MKGNYDSGGVLIPAIVTIMSKVTRKPSLKRITQLLQLKQINGGGSLLISLITSIKAIN